jgi:hypothetical protein
VADRGHRFVLLEKVAHELQHLLVGAQQTSCIDLPRF